MGGPFPVDNGMTSFWRTELDALDDYRSTETLPETSDIVIVGSGYAGASTAYHCQQLAQSTASQPSIVILEARQACSGATGRNGGQLKPDVYCEIGTLADKYGVEAAEEVAAFEVEHLSAVQSCIDKEQIECDLVFNEVIDVHFDDSLCDKIRAGHESLVLHGAHTAQRTEFSPQATAESLSGVKGARGCFKSRTGRFWPYKFVTGLLKRVVSAGANLQTHTPVLQVSETSDNDGRWTVTTSRGSIRAKRVIFCSNAYTAAIAPEYKDKIIPVRGVCSRIVVPNPPECPLGYSYTFRFNEWDYDYLIPRPDGSIVAGGAKSTFFHNPSDWFNNPDDSKLIEAAAHYFDDYMQRHFHGWEDTGAHTDRVWTGIMAYTTDYLPHIGEIPGKPGQMVIAGFNGHGMPQIFLSAKAIAQMIVNGAEYEATGLPRLFKTTTERLENRENPFLAYSNAAGR
ncbi:FAD dependent oxidoreductase [Aspergillus avenaceus]|uniref:FAD dependent oxidoreductase n=1 Tax=Aspergillus avenaceus TaxID=36643 RepID=A0A5N6TM89_ASPAV|nr:FAD dependent oxidoreductase [Aspergillus avenaceus]